MQNRSSTFGILHPRFGADAIRQNGISSSVSGSDASGPGAWLPMSPPRSTDAPRPPPPPPPPSSTTRSPLISVVYRLLPSLSSHWRVCSLPSTYTCLPLVRYSVSDSAVLPHSTTRCHSVFS